MQGPPARGLGIAHNRRVLRVPSGPTKKEVLKESWLQPFSETDLTDYSANSANSADEATPQKSRSVDFRLTFEREKRGKKGYNTQCSLVVSYRTTSQAQWDLTSEFGWDPVYYPWYGRIQQRTLRLWALYRKRSSSQLTTTAN